jgi:cobalt-precorrin 5A hydrolase
MGAGKVMVEMIAIGIGCRKSCDSAVIVDLVLQSLIDCEKIEGVRRLFSVIDKSEEAGLAAAARTLGIDLVLLPREALNAVAPRLLTRSMAAQRRFGLDSVAEAAALAGAGLGASLLGPRRAAHGATCAIAFVPRAKPVPSA